jgi:PDZ domain
MRALILLLPLAVAFAGDPSPLEEATKRWASDSAEERDAASRFVATHVRRELAPLVAALQSGDPEVRRRARSALESLLPPRPPEPPVQEEPVMAGQVIVLNNAGGGGVLQVRVNAKGRAVLVDAGEAEQLKAKGIAGMPVDDPVMREQLALAEGRGFAVSSVEPRSDAECLGILANDILLSIDGRPVKQAADVVKALEARAPGITLLRRGKLLTLGLKEGEGAPGEGK